MDLRQKLEFQEVIDNYLSEHQVYELFQSWVSDLMIDKPDDPIEYLLKKLIKPDIRRVMITGGSGRIRKEVSKELSSKFHMELVSVGDLLRDEVEKNSKLAGKILACWKEGTYVKDSLILEIVMPIIEQLENKRVSYILEGIPRTRSQALALQRAAIIPERVLVFDLPSAVYKSDFIENFSQFAQNDADIDTISEYAYEEYDLGLKGVFDEYTWQCHRINADDDISTVLEQAAKVILAKGRGHISRKPPKILIIGGPLSGKTSQTKRLAQRYGLVYVAVTEIVENAVRENSDIGKLIKEHIKSGLDVPDKLIIELMRDRLESTDCAMNGWVLDGFPSSFEQCRALKYLNKLPTNVFFLEANDNLIFERAKMRKIDPKTGKIYGKDAPEDIELVSLPMDNEDNLKIRLQTWREDTIKIHAEYSKVGKSIKAEIPEILITDSIGDTIEGLIPTEVSQ